MPASQHGYRLDDLLDFDRLGEVLLIPGFASFATIVAAGEGGERQRGSWRQFVLRLPGAQLLERRRTTVRNRT